MRFVRNGAQAAIALSVALCLLANVPISAGAGGDDHAGLAALLNDKGQGDADEVLAHPTVRRRLAARLSPPDLSYFLRTFEEFHSLVWQEDGHIRVGGKRDRRREEVVDDDWETVIAFLRTDGAAVHVGIDAAGRRAVYSTAASYADLPDGLKKWLHDSWREKAPGWHRPPNDLIWVRSPDQPNAMSAVIAALVASDKKPPASHERISLEGKDFGADRALVEKLVADIVLPEEFDAMMRRVGIARYDINDDGAPELFVYLGLGTWTCGSAGCELLIFEGPPGARTEFSGMASGDTLRVWINSETGHKTVYAHMAGLRWTGADYEWFCYRRCFPRC